ncbi:MAG: hypothetical protein WAN34_11965 [Acidimicrobiia bacterium]
MTRRLAAALAVASLILGACTSEGAGPSATDEHGTVTTASSTTTTLGSTEAVDEFRQCLAEKGVDIEAVPLDATGRPRLDLVLRDLDFGDPIVRNALTECSHILESGALDLGGEEVLRQDIYDELKDFSDCMVRLGVEDFPDPVPGYLGVGSPFPVAEIPYSDPEFDQAVSTCREDLLRSLGVDVGDS